MKLSLEQVEQVMPSWRHSSRNAYHLPGFGILTAEQLLDGVREGILSIHYENSRFYISVATETLTTFDKKGKETKSTRCDGFDAWYKKTWPVSTSHVWREDEQFDYYAFQDLISKLKEKSGSTQEIGS